jgi:hypothetical protein
MLVGHRRNLLMIIRMSKNQVVGGEGVVEDVAEAEAEDAAGDVELECVGVCSTQNNRANSLIN